MNRIFKRKLVFVKVCSPFSFIRFTNAEKIPPKKRRRPQEPILSPRFTSPPYTSPRFITSPGFTSPRFTSPVQSSPVQSSKYSVPRSTGLIATAHFSKRIKQDTRKNQRKQSDGPICATRGIVEMNLHKSV